MQFELDTGAAVTVMAKSTFLHLFPNLTLQQSMIALKTYMGELMSVVGEISLEVLYQDQGPKSLPLVVVQGSGPALRGRNWLS